MKTIIVFLAIALVVALVGGAFGFVPALVVLSLVLVAWAGFGDDTPAHVPGCGGFHRGPDDAP